MTHAFISYSRKDTPFVDQLENALHERGLVTWRDVHNIPGGARWFQRIKAGLESSFAMIYVDTPSAEASEWVEIEFLYAVELKLPIIPIKLDEQFISIYTINRNPILCGAAHFATGVLRLDAQLRTLPQQPIKTGATPPPVVSPETVTSGAAALSIAPLDDKAIRDYLDWLRAKLKAEQREPLYVNLAAQTERHTPAQHELTVVDEIDEFTFTFTSVPLEQIRGDDFNARGQEVADARDAILEWRRVVLLGEPGAGKSTTLRKIVSDLARAVEKDSSAPLPVFIPLREFKGTQSIAEFVRANLYNLGEHADTLFAQKRLVLLCDALNEMPRTATDRRDLVAEVRDYLQDKPDWVISCRVRDYQNDLSSISGIGKIQLKPLDPPRIWDFIQRKYTAQPERGAALWGAMGGSDLLLTFWQQVSDNDEPERFWDVKSSVPGYTSGDADSAWYRMRNDHRRLLMLCRSPFMANMVCALYLKSTALPENRAKLFADFIANLLHNEQSRLAAVGLKWIGDAPIHKGMGQIAWALGAQTEMARDAAESILREHLPEHEPAQALSAAASAQIIDYGANVRFTHQLLQQYFAAAVLGEMMDANTNPAAIWKPANWWEATGREETAFLLAGHRSDPEGVARWLAPAQPEVAHELLTQPDFALEIDNISAETKAALIGGANGKKADTAPSARAAAYRVLGLLNADLRPGVGVKDGIPDIVWCKIPAGTYTIGGDERAYNSLPAQQYEVQHNYWMAQYPITYAQFQAFLDAEDGFDSDESWAEMPEGYRKQSMQEQAFQYPNHPRERVSWYQAVAFTRWVTAKYSEHGLFEQYSTQSSNLSPESLMVRLPTEQEWETAARYPDGREYPWGSDFDRTRANTDESDIRQTTAVGLYPSGRNPNNELYDLSGNVWEWCLNEYEQPERTQLERTAPRVLRGGSWHAYDDFARAASRSDHSPSFRDGNLGFRVVVSLFLDADH